MYKVPKRHIEDWPAYLRRSGMYLRNDLDRRQYTRFLVRVLHSTLRAAARVAPHNNFALPSLLREVIPWRSYWWLTVQTLAANHPPSVARATRGRPRRVAAANAGEDGSAALAASTAIESVAAAAPISNHWRHHSAMGNRGLQWDTILVNTLGPDWAISEEVSKPKVKSLRRRFVISALAVLDCRPLPVLPEIPSERPSKIPRCVPPLDSVMFPILASVAVLQFLGDSSVVVGWITGACICEAFRLLPIVQQIQKVLHSWWVLGLACPSQADGGEWLAHIHREINDRADAAADLCHRNNAPVIVCDSSVNRASDRLRITFDGSGGKAGRQCSAGICVEAAGVDDIV